jgi:hypothetical protein
MPPRPSENYFGAAGRNFCPPFSRKTIVSQRYGKNFEARCQSFSPGFPAGESRRGEPEGRRTPVLPRKDPDEKSKKKAIDIHFEFC